MQFTSPSKRISFALVSVAYVVWVLSGPYVRTGFQEIGILPASVGSGVSVGVPSFPIAESGRFEEAYRILKGNYYGFDTVSENDLVSGMVKGMVDSLGDKHTEYFDIDETKKFNEALSGDFEGIWAVVDEGEFGVVVKQILAGSPAKESGIQSGDIIAKAGWFPLEGLKLSDAIEKIRGPAGSVVELEILRSGENGPITKSVTRRKIVVPSVDGKMIEWTKTAYVALSIFGEKTSFEFLKTYADLRKQGADSLIIDLRDNGGGLLETAVNLLSNFVPKDKLLVATKETNPFMNRSYFSEGPGDTEIPIVVLVNENSASASEITAGALKDYGRAVIVGTKTYGKGSVQQPFSLSDGSELKVTVAKWYTPLDHGIDKIGIEPDVLVKFEKSDFEKRYDRQLEKAKEVAERLKKSDRKTVLSEYQKESEQAKEIDKAAITAWTGAVQDKK